MSSPTKTAAANKVSIWIQKILKTVSQGENRQINRWYCTVAVHGCDWIDADAKINRFSAGFNRLQCATFLWRKNLRHQSRWRDGSASSQRFQFHFCGYFVRKIENHFAPVVQTEQRRRPFVAMHMPEKGDGRRELVLGDSIERFVCESTAFAHRRCKEGKQCKQSILFGYHYFWTVCFLGEYFYSHLFRTKTASIMIRHRICCRYYRKDRLQWLKCWHKLFWISTKMTLNLVKLFRPNAPTSKGNCAQNSLLHQPEINEKLICSIINALGMKTFSVADNNDMPATQIKVEDLNLETPMSSMNVTPDHVRSLSITNSHLKQCSHFVISLDRSKMVNRMPWPCRTFAWMLPTMRSHRGTWLSRTRWIRRHSSVRKTICSHQAQTATISFKICQTLNATQTSFM